MCDFHPCRVGSGASLFTDEHHPGPRGGAVIEAAVKVKLEFGGGVFGWDWGLRGFLLPLGAAG